MPHPGDPGEPATDTEDAMQVDTLISGGTVVTMDAERRVLARGAVAIRGNRIAAVGPAQELERRCEAARRIVAGGKLVLPGFINLHSHTPLLALRGKGEDQGSASLYGPAMAVSSTLTEEDTYHLAMLGFYELIRFGSTTVGENYHRMQALAPAAERIGIRAALSEMVADADLGQPLGGGPVLDRARGEALLRVGLDLADRWHGKADGRITVQLSPHAPNTCSAELLQTMAQEARRRGLCLTMHLAQHPPEVAQVKAAHGCGSVEFLDRLGLLGPGLIAAHCIYVSEAEIALLAASGTVLAHCASINAKRGRFGPAIEVLSQGGTVGLGTDNYHGNISEVWKFAQAGARFRSQNGSRLPALELLELATINGAKGLGLEASLGSLEPGKLADLVIVDLQRPHFYPLIDPVGSAVHNMVGSDVETVLIDGRIVLEGGRLTTLPGEAILANAQAAAESVWGRLRERFPGA
jgi:5-methylthioadenosine/S-adenosylhomocysteine deaminase